MRPSNNLEDSVKHILKSSASMYEVCMKVQAHRSLEPPPEYNLDQISLVNQGSL